MRGSYNAYLLRQVMRCNPPLLKVENCKSCQWWDVNRYHGLCGQNGLCGKWNNFTEPLSRCDLYLKEGE